MDNNKLFSARMTYLPSKESKGGKMEIKTFYEILMESSKRGIIEKVDAIRREADPNKQQMMKEAMPCFMPSGIFEGDKKKENLKLPSGFISIDIDKKDNLDFKGFENLKDMFFTLPFIAFCAHSVRGDGYYCLIPIKDTQHAEDLAGMIAAGFGRCGLKLDKCWNINRIRFLSYDPCPYINTGAIPYDSFFPYCPPNPRNAAEGSGNGSDDISRLEHDILPEIVKNEWDITGDYPQWFQIICAIKKIYADDLRRGLGMAIRISQFSPLFTEAAVRKEYAKNLTEYDYSIGTIIHYFQMAAGKSPGRVSAQDDFAGISEEDLQNE